MAPVSQDADSTGDDAFDSFVPNPRGSCDFQTGNGNYGLKSAVRIWIEETLSLGPDETGRAQATVRVDSRLAAGAYDGFEGWTIGNATARYTCWRLETDNGLSVVYVSAFSIFADAQERTERHPVIASGGTVLTFDEPYFAAPMRSAWR